MCLELESGRQVGSRDFRQQYGLVDDLFAVGSSPLVIDDKLVFNVGAANRNAGIIAMDRHSGETVWTATDHGAAYCSPFFARIHDQDFVYIELWRDRHVLDSQYNTLMLADGLVFGFTSAGQGGAELRCIEMATGKLRWK